MGHDPKEAVLAGQIAQHLGRRVAGPVVHHDDFEAEGSLAECFLAELHELGEILCFVLGGN
jgi:hypothetical protein